jgi:hypothetical protein
MGALTPNPFDEPRRYFSLWPRESRSALIATKVIHDADIDIVIVWARQALNQKAGKKVLESLGRQQRRFLKVWLLCCQLHPGYVSKRLGDASALVAVTHHDGEILRWSLFCEDLSHPGD